MNKKGFEFGFFFVAITGMILLAVFAFRLAELTTSEEYHIGTTQQHYLDSYHTEQDYLWYAHDSARLALEPTLEKIGKQGGITENCGKTGEYIHWNNGEKTCYDEKIYDSFSTRYHQELSTRLARYDTSTTIGLSTTRYEFHYDKESIAGLALTPLDISFTDDGTRTARAVVGHDTVYPHFRIHYPHHLGNYKELQALADVILDICPTEQNIEQCIQEQISISELTISIDGQPDDMNRAGYYFFTAQIGNEDVKIGLYIEPDERREELPALHELT